jgi:sporulation protein YlmC with PRC-barrel domain
LNKFRTSAAVAALLIGAAPLAYAQTNTTPTTPSTPPATHAAPPATHAASAMPTMIQPDQFRASKMIGSSVYDVQNRDIGSVKDLIVDKDGKVAAVIVDVGTFLGMGGKSVAVDLADIKSDNNRLTLNKTKEQLQQAQAYKLENETTGAGSSTSPVRGGHLGTGAGSDTTPRRDSTTR